MIMLHTQVYPEIGESLVGKQTLNQLICVSFENI